MDLEGEVEVLEGDGVGGEAGELVGQLGEGGEVLLKGDVEGVGVLEVDGDCCGVLVRNEAGNSRLVEGGGEGRVG